MVHASRELAASWETAEVTLEVRMGGGHSPGVKELTVRTVATGKQRIAERLSR